MKFGYNFMRFPGFRDRALTLSYDDGTVHDKRLAEIMKKYGVRGTFNINSGRMGKDRRLTQEEMVELYNDDHFEVAVHGYKHYPLTSINIGSAVWDIAYDRANLENTFGKIIRGMAYANGDYNDEVVDMLQKCGIVYARTVTSTENFDIPTDWLRLPATCHHRNPRLMELAEEFLKPTDPNRAWYVWPKLFYLWGHSYEFADNDNWEIIEEFCEKVGNNDEVWYATNIEIYEYVKAFDNLVFSHDNSMVYNPSAQDVYLRFYKQNILVKAGQTLTLPIE